MSIDFGLTLLLLNCNAMKLAISFIPISPNKILLRRAAT
jgi:hypothetical protein